MGNKWNICSSLTKTNLWWQEGQNIFQTAVVDFCSDWSKKDLIGGTAWRMDCVVRYRWAPLAYIYTEVNPASARKALEYTVHPFLLHARTHTAELSDFKNRVSKQEVKITRNKIPRANFVTAFFFPGVAAAAAAWTFAVAISTLHQHNLRTVASCV